MINKSEGKIFNLNGINIKLSIFYKWSVSNKLNHIVSHMEFKSLTVKKPNDISETGYKSEWLQNEEHELYFDILDLIDCYVKSHNIKIYNLNFEEKKEIEAFEEISLF